VIEPTFHTSASISKTYMPCDEMAVYAKNYWQNDKNQSMNLPRNFSLNNSFDNYNKTRYNYTTQ
jgi:hypothetical protein